MAIEKLSLSGATRSKVPETKYQTSLSLPDEQAKLFEGLCAAKNMQRPAMFAWLVGRALENLSEKELKEAEATYDEAK